MRYLKESSLYDFPAWSGGADTLEVLKENGDVDTVEEYINEINENQEEPMTDTEVNDILWHERDSIAEYLGYRDWDAYEIGELEEDDEDWDDEEEEEEDEDPVGVDLGKITEVLDKVAETLKSLGYPIK